MNKNNISIVGIGKLGLCFALTLEKAGYNVVGIDVNQNYVDSINTKTLHSFEAGVEEALKQSKNFLAATDLSLAIQHSDTIFILVATPSLPDNRYNHEQIENVVRQLEIMGIQKSSKRFIVGCTVMPGYCDSLKDRLHKLNYTICYNPEFIAQGTILRDQSQPDMVLIGEEDIYDGDILQDIYTRHTINNPKICRMKLIEAEITKISLNCFITTKISFANMIGDIVLKSGGDPTVVLNAIGSDTRVGNKCLKFGFGFGGPCFPRDNRALGVYAKDINCPVDISESTDKLNKLHIDEQVNMFVKNHSKSNKVIFNTITYKPESNLIEESQQLEFAKRLALLGYNVEIIERQDVIHQLLVKCGNIFTYVVRN